MRISTTSTTSTTSRLGALLAAVAVLWGASGAAGAEGPRELIERASDQVVAILRDDSRSPDARRAELERLAREHFDFRTMARLVLGRSWKELEPSQREAFVEEFQTYLANDYGSRVERYDQEEIAVVGDEPKPRGDVVVKTRVVGGENDGALVDYRLRERDGRWGIIDVVIEGISLVANFRDQFREVMGRGGPENLLERLREKNAESQQAG